MQNRINSILSDPVMRAICEEDAIYTFKNIGLDKKQVQEMCEYVVKTLSQKNKPLKQIEAEIFNKFESTEVKNSKGISCNLRESINEKLSGRASLIMTQIAPHLGGIPDVKFSGSPDILDFGAGNGKVAQLVQDQTKLKNGNTPKVAGVDVADYKAEDVSIPIAKFDGKRAPFNPATVKCIVSTNVLHHELHNQQCLEEFVRLLEPSGKLVIIETVPVGATKEAIKNDRDRTFWNDLIYNRWFNTADGDGIPVPGTYETPEGWIQRIEALGFELVHSKDLGIDQPTIRDTHHLLTFKMGVPLKLTKSVMGILSNRQDDIQTAR